jgi:hypothetical protein
MFCVRGVSSRIKRNAVKVPTITSRTKFSDTARDALEGGVKYSPLILVVAGAVSVLGGVILEFSSLQAQITLAGEKIKSIESSTGEKIKSIESSTGEKINASVDKSVRIALEDFLKYSYSSEFEGMREKKDRKVIGKESDSSER